MKLVLEDIKLKNVADEQRTKIIRKEVQLASKAFRSKYPIFKHQNAIGFFIFEALS